LSGIRFEEEFWEIAERSIFYREILVNKMEGVAALRAQSTLMGNNSFPLPNLIRPDHPARKFLDVLLPKGSKRREFVKSIVRLFK